MLMFVAQIMLLGCSEFLNNQNVRKERKITLQILFIVSDS